MPWSDWQPPTTIKKFTNTKQIYRNRTAGGVEVDPSYNSVQVLNSGPSTFANVTENKPTWDPQPTMQACWQWYADPGWQSLRPSIPAPLQELVYGVEYSVVPGREPNQADAYVEYQPGANTLSWNADPLLTLTSYSGNPQGNFRVRWLAGVHFTTPGTFPPSAWGTIDTDSTVVASGTPAMPASTELGTISLPDNLEGWLLYVESDSTADASLVVGAYPGRIDQTVTTPQWRYWIPEVPYYNPTPPPTKILRALVVDLSDDVPVVDSVAKVVSDHSLTGGGDIPSGLAVPSLNRLLLATGNLFSVWTTDGVKVWEANLTDGDNWYPTVFSNPNDPTECAVVYATTRIFIIKNLDTSTPSVAYVVTGFPQYDDDWLTWSTDPYYLSHGLSDGEFENYVDGTTSNPIPWRNINEPGPDRYIGELTSWYDDPAGTSRWGRARTIHAYIGENDLVDSTDLNMTAIIADYRDPDALKVQTLEWYPGEVIPNFPLDDWRLDWLMAGSHTLSADVDGTRGVAISGFTTLSRDMPDSTTVPGVTLYSERFSVVVALIQGPITSLDTGGEQVQPQTVSPTKGTVALHVAQSHFWAQQTSWNTPSLLVPPDANHLVVGDGLLTSTDHSAYLEFTATAEMNNANWEDSIGGVLPIPTLPPGHMINGTVHVEADFYATVWRPGQPYYNSVYYDLIPVLPDGSLDWARSSGWDDMPYTPGVWTHVDGDYDRGVGRLMVEELMKGTLAVVLWPQGGGGNAATLRVSNLKVTFHTVGYDS